MDDTRKILDSIWFDKIGIVRVLDKNTGESKCYIGQGDGYCQELDELKIADWGMPFYETYIFSRLTEERT